MWSGKVAGPAFSNPRMPRLILSLLAIAVLFCLLCGPVTWVALRLWKRGDLAAFRPLRAVWVAQVALASALIFGTKDTKSTKHTKDPRSFRSSSCSLRVLLFDQLSSPSLRPNRSAIR